MQDRSAPTAALSPQEKRALLMQLLQHTAHPSPSPSALSHGQKALWFTHRLAPQSWAYHVVFSTRIRSEVALPTLQRALQLLIDRHPILRTTYTVQDGQPVQQVQAHMQIDFVATDAARWNDATLRTRLRHDTRQPFDLEHGPILRARLYSHTPADHYVLLVAHHIAIDFWSLGVLLAELRALYAALRDRQAISLPPVTPYTEYVRQQTEMLAGPEGERLRTYWQQQLAGELPVLALPTDRPRPPVQTDHGATHRFTLPADVVQGLHTLARVEGVTLYMILLAAFQVLLHRYTTQDDILVGSPMAGRHQPQWRHVVGYFTNPVVLRANLSGQLTFVGFLRQVRQTVLEALNHAHYPFSRLVEHLQPARDPSRCPVFQTSFVWQTLYQHPDLLPLFMPTASQTSIDFGGLKLEPFVLTQQEGQFDLTLEMAEVEAQVLGHMKYNTDLFEATTIVRMAGQFSTLLRSVGRNPDAPLAALPLLSDAEWHQVLVAWNATQTAYPHAQCLPQLFEAQVARTPDATAVVYQAEQVTYRELNRRANHLAHYLQALGVGPEVLVGLCIDPCPDLVIGLLGILKAGAAYVPLDPCSPRERLAFILQDAQVSLLLTRQPLALYLPQHQAHVVYLDTAWPHIAQYAGKNPVNPVRAAHVAYVIYTSGSTGQPKGTMIPHSGLANYLLWCTQAYPVSAGYGAPVHSSIAFDLTVTALFVPLIVGQRVLLVPAALGVEGLSTMLRQQRYASLVKLTPAHLELLSHQIPKTEVAGTTRALIIGGEALRPEHIARWRQAAPDTILINEYGPTETVVGCCIYRVPATASHTGAIPIGHPIANTQLYVLDAHLQPVPIGVLGELHIGGAGVARGYLHRPALTAEMFRPHPFSDTPGARLYKTGDRGRYRPDGHLEFLGRRDDQVKIRGFRLELGEIEAVLGQHPALEEGVVVIKEETPGDKRLVAYCVAAKESALTPRVLRQFLEAQLPPYMIPSVFVMLDMLPLTPNGKVDRQALPLAPNTHQRPEGTIAAPRTPQEAQLTAIWRQVLGIAQVDIHDNFFTLGGHSLQAVQLVSQVATAMPVELSVRDLFLHPTIATLAEALSARRHMPGCHRLRAGAGTVLAASQNAQPMLPSSPLTTFEHRPLLPLFASGEIVPVDAATLAYWPRTLLEQTGLSRDDILHDWCDHRPGVFSTLEMSLGRIALIVLPCFDVDLYRDTAALTAVTLEALAMARQIGARTVTLSGLLPSATAYGHTIATAMTGRHDLPQVSTGHATTTAAVVLTIDRLLRAGGRDLARERVGFLGLGSIGCAALRLMLHCLPHPDEIVLCDAYHQRDRLETMRQELLHDIGFQGAVRIVESRPDVPPAFYEATLIVGATNAPDILDVTRVQPGTLIVDDSAPHCFNTRHAVQRLQDQHDLLFTEGGAVRSLYPISERRYVPRAAAQTMTVGQLDALFIRHDPFEIMGCTLSSLLSSRFAHLQPTVGRVDHQTSRQHYAELRQLGFQAASLHCEGYVVTEDERHHFQQRFGKARSHNTAFPF